jgi:hypothetical protein
MFKYTLIYLLLTISLSAQTKQKIVGVYTENSAYCGGARPSQEILADLERPIPTANKVLYLKKGSSNITKQKKLIKVITNANGQFNFLLAPGKYCIVGSDKIDTKYFQLLVTKYSKDSKTYKAIDKKCLTEWLMEPLHSFEVKSSNNDTIKIHYTKPCDWNSIPCAQFTGAIPP